MTDAAATPDRALRVLTWNVNGLDESRLGQRMEKLCLEMLVGGDLAAALRGAPTPPMPDVILLQEVVPVAHQGYFRPHLTAAGYAIRPETPPDRSYYEMIAVRAPFAIEHAEHRPFEHSPLARGCLSATLVDARDPARRVTVMTSHMESLRSGAEPRLDQAKQIDEWLRTAGTPAIFGGDTNLRESEWARLEEGFSAQDAFTLAGSPKRARDTWRPEGGGRGRRFDRVFVDAASGWRVLDLRLRWSPRASDHAGLEVLLVSGPPDV